MSSEQERKRSTSSSTSFPSKSPRVNAESNANESCRNEEVLSILNADTLDSSSSSSMDNTNRISPSPLVRFPTHASQVIIFETLNSIVLLFIYSFFGNNASIIFFFLKFHVLKVFLHDETYFLGAFESGE